MYNGTMGLRTYNVQWHYGDRITVYIASLNGRQCLNAGVCPCMQTLTCLAHRLHILRASSCVEENSFYVRALLPARDVVLSWERGKKRKGEKKERDALCYGRTSSMAYRRTKPYTLNPKPQRRTSSMAYRRTKPFRVQGLGVRVLGFRV